jgi:hypothetical protein
MNPWSSTAIALSATAKDSRWVLSAKTIDGGVGGRKILSSFWGLSLASEVFRQDVAADRISCGVMFASRLELSFQDSASSWVVP